MVAGIQRFAEVGAERIYLQVLDLTDLALRVRGPVARHAVATFRDGWAHSRLLECRAAPTPGTLRQLCAFTRPASPWPLGWAGPAPAAGGARVYGLYRRSGYADADDAVTALFGAARTSIDVMQSQVSGSLGCVGRWSEPGGCDPALQLPVWRAALRAVRERGVRLRLLLDYDPLLQAETLAFLRGLEAELAPLGLADHVQVVLQVEHRGQGRADQVLIVDEHQADRRGRVGRGAGVRCGHWSSSVLVRAVPVRAG